MINKNYLNNQINNSTIAFNVRSDHVSISISILIIGISSAFYINLIGQFFIAEIILILTLPILLFRSKTLVNNTWTNRILGFGLIWFLGQVITDLFRETSIYDIARGWASILVFLVSFYSLFLLLSTNISRIKYYLLGVCLGGLLKNIFQPLPSFGNEPWKFGYGPVLTLFILLIIISTLKGNLRKLNQWFLPLLCLGGLSFYLNARSIGAFTILTAFFMVIVKTKGSINFFNNIRIGKVIILLLVIFGFTLGILKFYAVIVEQGWLGDLAKTKYEQQSSGVFGLLLGGRAEILGSIHAVMDSPIIGHGSWAKDPKYRSYYYILRKLGYDYSTDQIKYSIGLSDLIPTHSHIFQNWVWAGILGAIFWVMILLLVLRSLFISIRNLNPLFVLVIYLAIASVWDILFSPFGSFMRLDWALRLVVFIAALNLPGVIPSVIFKNKI